MAMLMGCVHFVVQDNNNLNNILTVLPKSGDNAAQRDRLLAADGKLMEEERLELAAMLCPWSSHDVTHHLPGSDDGTDGDGSDASLRRWLEPNQESGNDEDQAAAVVSKQ